jgi:hypothetical protein
MDSGATLLLVEKHISRHLAVTDQIHSQSGPEFQSTRYSRKRWGFGRCIGYTPRTNGRTSFVSLRKIGRGGGDRTHDLRLKRPLLYH